MMSNKTTWYKELKGEFEKNGDDFSKMITSLTKEDIHREFNPGYGAAKGESFIAWGENFVYFPVCYDGSEWVESVPRNPTPDDKWQPIHFGGG